MWIAIFALMSIVLYLIVRASDETREVNIQEGEVKQGVLWLAKKNVCLTVKNVLLKNEKKRLIETNADLRAEHEEAELLVYHTNVFLNDVMSVMEEIAMSSKTSEDSKKLAKAVYKQSEDFIKNELEGFINTTSSNG